MSREGERYGPYSWEQLSEFAAAGRVGPQDFVWGEGMADWAAATEVEGLLGSPAAAAPPADPAAAAPRGPAASASEPREERQPAAPSRQGASADDEEIVGIIPAMRRKKGLFSSKMYNLVVTDRRIVFAEVTKEMRKQAAEDAAAEAKADGKGFFARAAATAGSRHRVYQKYWQMTPEAVLAEQPENYAVEHREIASVRIRGGRFDHESGQQDPDELHIKTTVTKMKLFFERGGSSEAKELLKKLLGDRVR